MYRVGKMGNKVYAMKIDFKEDAENILAFVESGDPIILCGNIWELECYGIDEDDVTIVEPE